MVSFSPNWNPILPGESVTLTCNVAPTAQENVGYSWYRDGHQIPGDQQRLVIESARETDSVDYQCQTRLVPVRELTQLHWMLILVGSTYKRPLLSTKEPVSQASQSDWL
ncbi:hypothetical protein XELAEV_18040712mg [Xenopus laevis]|uniref:Ig-like domain-containing protein n=1 Tax=Xenopus laevis TaxID=8355 RepID=A0A974CA89_XENLA|nr:hypothetical protein XELAEV_18040712mg [Xenopus laevis]